MPKTILMLTANPTNTQKLKLTEEIEEIERALQRNQRHQQFEFKAQMAVTPNEVRQALLDYQPHFVHFSGHGAAELGIILENEQGKHQYLSTDTLAQVFEPYRHQIECVILNACFTAVQASAIVKHINYVIGMNQPIDDRAAIQFTIGFYDALAANESIETAFEMGRYTIAANLATLEEHLKPVLKKRYPKTVYHLPISRNRFFTGRKLLLRQIQETLHFQKAAALSGFGGIGKTQTAAQYAYLYGHEYQAVLWSLADTVESLKSGLVEIAHALDLPEKQAQKQKETIQAVRHWLQTHNDWLLILDNADNLSLIDPILGSDLGQSHLLLTTRAQTTEPIAQKIPMSIFSLEEGTSFLLRRALDKPRSDSGVEWDYSASDQFKAEDIAKILDNLPLALDQAGAYIRETQCGLAGYLERYGTHAAKLLAKRGSSSSDHPEAVAKTWLLSFDKIANENATASDILYLSAFLHPDKIAEDIFSDIDVIALDEALSVIFKYSLLHREPKTKTLSIHRLVQLILKQGMAETEQRTWAEMAVRVVNSVFPDGNIEFSEWNLCERLLPCAQTCAALIEEWALEFAQAALLLNQTGYYLKEKAEYAQAKPLYERALAIREKMLGKEHPDVATSLNNLAGLYRAQGAYEQALPLSERAFAIFEKVHGKEHPEVASSLNNLALLYKAQGAYEQAKPLYERALQILNKFFKSDHPHVRTVSENYARLLEKMEYSG